MSRRVLPILLVAAACGLIGFLVGRQTSAGGDATAPHTPDNPAVRRGIPSTDAPQLVGQSAADAPDGGESGRAPDVRAMLDDVDGSLIQGEVARRAERIRGAAAAQIENAETIARARVEREIAKERAVLADQERGGAHAMLKHLWGNWVPPHELLADQARFAGLFERKTESEGAVADGTALRVGDVLSDGDRIEFPPGVHGFDPKLLEGLEPFPQDLLLTGYGMDETLVRLHGWSSRFGKGDVHTLTFQDMTIDCGYAPLQVTSQTFLLRLIRCRVIGFDRGAGGSEMLNGGNGAFYATGCRIEIGFGDAPVFASLFRVQRGLIARLEDCTIHGPIDLGGHGQQAYLFHECRFLDLDRMRHPMQVDSPPPGVRFVDCEFNYLAEGEEGRRKTLPLSTLNPRWK